MKNSLLFSLCATAFLFSSISHAEAVSLKAGDVVPPCEVAALNAAVESAAAEARAKQNRFTLSKFATSDVASGERGSNTAYITAFKSGDDSQDDLYLRVLMYCEQTAKGQTTEVVSVAPPQKQRVWRH